MIEEKKQQQQQQNQTHTSTYIHSTAQHKTHTPSLYSHLHKHITHTARNFRNGRSFCDCLSNLMFEMNEQKRMKEKKQLLNQMICIFYVFAYVNWRFAFFPYFVYDSPMRKYNSRTLSYDDGWLAQLFRTIHPKRQSSQSKPSQVSPAQLRQSNNSTLNNDIV